MKNNELIIEFRPGLGGFLDSTGLKYRTVEIDNVGLFFIISFTHEVTPSFSFDFAIDFTKWCAKYDY